MTVTAMVTGVRHVGLYAPDPEALAHFYGEVLGLQTIGLSGLNVQCVQHSVFLGSCLEMEHHDLAIFANPKQPYTAFEVETLADLRTLYQRVVERNLPIRWMLNHGISLAFYFADPAGNLIKLYWLTGIAYPQPHGHPINLTQSETILRQDVAELVAQRKALKGGEV